MKHRTCLIAALALPLLGSEADELKSLDLQELLNLNVTSADRKERSLARTAAAITVITRDDIRRAGASTLAEALRLAPGLYVARASTGVWAISARGFAGQFANKLLVLIDGRSVYNPVNSGVFWDTLDMMLEDVERIEVIRGPGAAVWGANAVTGVVNVITRRAEDTLGGYFEAGSGSEDRTLLRFRYGQRISARAALRVSGQYGHRAPMSRDNPEEVAWPWRTARAGFRLDWDRSERDQVMLEGEGFYSGLRQMYQTPGPSGGTQVLPAENGASGGAITGRWTRRMLRGETAIQGYLTSEVRKRTHYVHGHLWTLDLDVQHRLALSARHELLFQAGVRSTTDQMDATERAWFSPSTDTYRILASTIRHEWQIRRDSLFLTTGIRLERTTYGGFQPQPTARILWAPSKSVSYWAAVSRAERTPSRYERGFSFLLASSATPRGILELWKEPNPEFASEVLRGYEAGVRVQPSPRITLDVAAFRSIFSDLEAWQAGVLRPGASSGRFVLPVRSVNEGIATAYGGEAAVKFDITPRWRVSGSLTQYRSRLRLSSGGDRRIEPRPDVFPHTMWHLLSTYDLTRRTQLNAVWYHTGQTGSGQHVAARERVDLGLRQRFNEWAGLAIGVQNALGSSLREYRPEDGSSPQFTRRTFYARLQWWF